MRISRTTIETFFEDNRRRGVSLQQTMLWGYFFVDPDRPTLEALIPVLVSRGYHCIGVLEAEDDSEFHRRVERVEAHTSETLYTRCVELDELAREMRVKDYDGFDVGNVDGSVLVEH